MLFGTRKNILHKRMLKFRQKNVHKCKFHAIKIPIHINDITIEHIVVANKHLIRKCFMYFFGYVNHSNDAY